MLFLDTWNALLMLRFLPRWVLNPLPTGNIPYLRKYPIFEIGAPHPTPLKRGQHCVELNVFVPSSVI